MSNPLYHAFIEAGTQAGYQKSADLNGERFEVVMFCPSRSNSFKGFGEFDRTISTKDGTRCNTATAYLHPVMKRQNLTVKTDTLVEKVLLRNSTCQGVRKGNFVILRYFADRTISQQKFE